MRKFTAMLLLVAATAAAGPEHDHDGTNACMEGAMAQFGRYVGDWKITDETLSRDDGKTWTPGQGARWTFECVGDGLAVQDFWMPTNGGFGTNLRTYNPSTASWEIVWAAKAQNGLMHISARQDKEGKIIMRVQKPKPPKPRRIIFYPPSADGWDWVMQMSNDEGVNWFDVYKITATPWEG